MMRQASSAISITREKCALRRSKGETFQKYAVLYKTVLSCFALAPAIPRR